MGKKINLFGSNHLTNNTCVFANMPGLAPTATVRSSITGLHGYKVARVAANEINWQTGLITDKSKADKEAGCGFNRGTPFNCKDGKDCIKHLNKHIPSGIAGNYRKGRNSILG